MEWDLNTVSWETFPKPPSVDFFPNSQKKGKVLTFLERGWSLTSQEQDKCWTCLLAHYPKTS